MCDSWKSRVVIVILVMLSFYGVMRLPVHKPIDQVYSPDRKWIARIEWSNQGGQFGESYYNVVLQPQDTLVGFLQEVTVFKTVEENSSPPKAVWEGTKKLTIDYQNAPDNILVQLPTYDGVRITYSDE